MKNEIEIPIQKEEDFVAANLRRDKYSQTRDLQAQEYNTAIATRLSSLVYSTYQENDDWPPP